MRRMRITLQHILQIKRLPESSVYKAIYDPEVWQPYERNERLARPFGVIARRLLNELQLTTVKILPVPIPDEPVWKLDISFCRKLCKHKKAKASPVALKMIFLDHQTEEHGDSVHIFTDGSKQQTQMAVQQLVHKILLNTDLTQYLLYLLLNYMQ